jgi:hypothetical protein
MRRSNLIFSTPCALVPVPHINKHGQAVTCPKPEELPKNGDVTMSLLDSVGGLGAIGRRNSNLKTDLVFYADAVGTAYWQMRDSGCART